jgi:ATP-dependent Lon protease
VLEGYSQVFTEEVDADKIEQVFSKVKGFIKQKEDAKSLLLIRKYFKAKNIKASEKGKILCLSGPPGVGKTYLGSKIAEVLGRKFFHINVGGEGSEQIINGSRTLVGSKVGGIIQAIQETKSCNPIILIDEVDKIKQDMQSGLINSLLHALDSEQNQEFNDLFLDIKLDISQITFILTANDLEKIPEPLKTAWRLLN